MLPTKITDTWSFFFKRAWILYVCALLIFYKGTDLYLMKVKTINHVVPQSMEPMAQFMLNPTAGDQKSLGQAINYYKTVVAIIPQSWSDWGFLGYAFYFKGDIERAKYCFIKAASHERSFFWYPYSLGMIYLKEGQYGLAERAFRDALSVSYPQTINLMQTYKSYNLLAPPLLNKGYNFEASLYDAIKNAQQMLAVCHFKVPINTNDPQYLPRMF